MHAHRLAPVVVLALALAACSSSSDTCPGGSVRCGDACALLATDGANCGVCGNACPGGQVCSAGQCAATCAAPLTTCGDGTASFCADTRSDPAHCGACDTACAQGQVCSAGRCAATCAAPLTICVGGGVAFCADTRSDPAHCGACDTACPQGQACAGGACVVVCAAPLATCGEGAAATCADTRSDPAHCGGCDTACAPGEVCDAGRCAVTCEATGSARCGDRCVDLASDDAHCGGCATACGPGTSCQSGRCEPTCPTGQTRCGDRCVTLSSDTANCGACGNACPAIGVCAAGTCQAPACVGSFGLPGEPDLLGARTYTVAAGDLDGDGLPDLALAAQPIDVFDHGTEVNVLRNQGGRSFAPAVRYDVGFPVRIALLGDVDGDGAVDLVAVGETKGALLHGRGDGTLGTPVTFMTLTSGSVSANGAALGDLDGDGRADLVLATGVGLAVYPGTRFGFGNAVTYPAGTNYVLYPQEVALGDVDGDHRLDVIAGEAQAGRVGVYRNDGSGKLLVPSTSVALSGSLQGLAAGDLDGDGLADAVAVDVWNSGMLEVLRADGQGGLLAPTAYPMSWGAQGVALGDLDADGLLDVAVGDWSDDRKVVLFHNAGGGALVPGGEVYDPGAAGMVWADLDGDLWTDLAVASGPGGGIHLLWNDRGALDQPALQAAPAADGVRAPSAVTVADLDGDGKRDAVAVEYQRGELLVFHGDGGGHLTLAQVVAAPYAAAVRVGDLDRDGRPDLLVCFGSVGAQVFRGTANGFVPGAELPPGRPYCPQVTLLDVDGDGVLDVVGAAEDLNGGGPAVWRGRGDATFAPPEALGPGGLGTTQLWVADVDGNGWPDLVAFGRDDLEVALGLGGGRFAPWVSTPLGRTFDLPELAFGDLDGDGKLDLAIADRYLYVVGAMLGRGDGTFGPLQQRQLFHPTELHVAAFGGRGRDAIVVRGAIGMPIAVYELDAQGVLQPPRVWTGLGADGIGIGDLDGDLRPDVVTGALDGVAVLRARCLP